MGLWSIVISFRDAFDTLVQLYPDHSTHIRIRIHTAKAPKFTYHFGSTPTISAVSHRADRFLMMLSRSLPWLALLALVTVYQALQFPGFRDHFPFKHLIRAGVVREPISGIWSTIPAGILGVIDRAQVERSLLWTADGEEDLIYSVGEPDGTDD